jgi:hypothetical protein
MEEVDELEDIVSDESEEHYSDDEAKPNKRSKKPKAAPKKKGAKGAAAAVADDESAKPKKIKVGKSCGCLDFFFLSTLVATGCVLVRSFVVVALWWASLHLCEGAAMDCCIRKGLFLFWAVCLHFKKCMLHNVALVAVRSPLHMLTPL